MSNALFFKATEDYALKAMVYLAAREGLSSSSDISHEASIPRDYLIQLAQNLRCAGLIEGRTGKCGGYMLAKKSSEISVYDILHSVAVGEKRHYEPSAASFFVEKRIAECLKAVTLEELVIHSAVDE